MLMFSESILKKLHFYKNISRVQIKGKMGMAFNSCWNGYTHTHTPLVASKAFLVPGNSQHPWMVSLSLRECTWWNETMPQETARSEHHPMPFHISDQSWNKQQNTARLVSHWEKNILAAWKMLYVTWAPGDNGPNRFFFCVLSLSLTLAPSHIAVFLFLWDYPRQALLWETESCQELPLMQPISFITSCKVKSTLSVLNAITVLSQALE